MQSPHRLLSLGLLAAAALAPAVFADGPLDKLRGELADQVIADARPDARIPVMIALSDRPSQQLVIGNKAERRRAITDHLKTHAARAATGVIDALGVAQKAGHVDGRVRNLWLGGAVAVDATPDVILEMAARDDVAWISWDRPIGEEVLTLATAGGSVECGVDLMSAPDVWALGYTGAGVVVGVIDTGVCTTHPDLADHVFVHPGEIAGNGIDDDGNGYVDDVSGWNFRDDNNNPFDDNGHGTHVSGTIAGDGTNGEQTGMAPDALIMPLKYWNNFSGESVALEAIQYGVDNGADILSGSFGWPHSQNPDRALWRETIENGMAAGVVMVFASGNEGSGNAPDNVRTPGDIPGVITVGATDCADVIASFSSTGPVTWQNVAPYFDWLFPPGKLKPTICAPGVNTLSLTVCSGYGNLSGTSMATPHVSGAIALLIQANPELDHDTIKQGLKDHSIDLGPIGPDNIFGAGRVDALMALEGIVFDCPADVNGDGQVGVNDMLTLLANWGNFPVTGDLTGDGAVNVEDLLFLLGQWGPCPMP